jgi:plasmid stabilization system protein ParE
VIFRVEWVQTALNQLTTIWMSADSAQRQAITAATHQIDQQLKANPYGPSESRPEGRRILFESPLGILFRIEADGKTVSVLQVWHFRKHSQP